MLGTKIGFDLGTTSIVANVDGKGIKINDPSVIVYDSFEEKVKAIGNECSAKRPIISRQSDRSTAEILLITMRLSRWYAIIFKRFAAIGF